MRVMDITEDTRFHTDDFSNERYRATCCYNRKNKPPVLIMMSESCNPPHWMVVDGNCTMFFLTRSEAFDYCHRRGYDKRCR